MIAEDFVARLDKARKNGERAWMARCPAHEDKGPSLKVTDSDGKILIHCFAGCSPAEIVQAVGLQLTDLFPPRDEREAAQYRRDRFARGTLQDMRHEVSIAMIVLGDVIAGRPVEDMARVKRARDTIIRLMTELNRAG